MEELSKFDYFHAEQPDSSNYDQLLDDYSRRSFKIYIQISELIKELKLKITPGVMDVLKSGYNISPETVELNQWKDILNILETKASPVVDSISEKIQQLHSLNDDISADEANLEII